MIQNSHSIRKCTNACLSAVDTSHPGWAVHLLANENVEMLLQPALPDAYKQLSAIISKKISSIGVACLDSPTISPSILA